MSSKSTLGAPRAKPALPPNPRAKLAALAAGVALGVLAAGCGKKKPDPTAVDTPPPQGVASAEELSVGLGGARALEESIAPSSAKWRRAITLDEKRAILIGEVTGEAVAIITDDGGRSWRPLREPRDGWAQWSAGDDGTVVLALGTRSGAKTQTGGTIDSTKVSFATFDKPPTPPIPLFPLLKGPVKGSLDSTSAVPFVLGPDLIAMYGEDGRAPTLFYGGRPGSVARPPTKLPSEKIIPVPYGRPPQLLSIGGGGLNVRPAPMPQEPLAKPQRIPGLVLPPSALADLSMPPACEFGVLSFGKLKGPPRPQMVAVGPGKLIAFALPQTMNPATNVGCNASKVVVETAEPVGDGPTGPTGKQTTLATCTFDGKCTKPDNNPFRVWPEQHEQELVPVVGDKGIAAVLWQKAGDRWGLYLAQSVDGKIYEMPRVIGEGKGDRGQLGLGALLSLGPRIVMLLSADVTGTSRRGWYVMISDDGGLNWGPP